MRPEQRPPPVQRLNAIPDVPPAPTRRPDPALPLIAAAFALGVVVASAGVLALRWTGGDTVPAGVHEATVTQLAAEQASRRAADAQVATQSDTLDAADALAQRLVAALDHPPVTPADLAELRRQVAAQSRTITRERVRVVRVPVPAPAPAPAAIARPRPARRPAPVAVSPSSPTPSPPGCTISLLGTCLAR